MGLVAKSTYTIPPTADQFEISLIGTGGGYGESVVAHLGNGEWLVVDSCQNPSTNVNLPLEYLQSIGVNPNENVKLIICTHWHDDHIQGISKILRACENADLSFARVNDIKKFLRLVGLDYSKVGNIGSLSSTKEFNDCIEILEFRGKGIKGAGPDRLLYKSTLSASEICEVFSLSPSDQAINNFDLELTQLITEYGEPRKRIVIDSPNDKSVVLYLRLGDKKVLLGADLEVTDSNNTGWFDIINNSTTIKNGKASYFKIPHHGSENGYHERIWIELLEQNPNANLSPWNKANGLPTPEMIKKFKEHSSKLFITSPKIGGLTKARKRDRDIEKIIEKFRFKLNEVKFSKGIIRNRIRTCESDWKTEIFESALKI